MIGNDGVGENLVWKLIKRNHGRLMGKTGLKQVVDVKWGLRWVDIWETANGFQLLLKLRSQGTPM